MASFGIFYYHFNFHYFITIVVSYCPSNVSSLYKLYIKLRYISASFGIIRHISVYISHVSVSFCIIQDLLSSVLCLSASFGIIQHISGFIWYFVGYGIFQHLLLLFLQHLLIRLTGLKNHFGTGD